MKKQYRPRKVSWIPQSVSTAKELEAAVKERRFQPWHVADLLDMAESAEDFDRAVESITALVGRGQRREVTRAEV